MQVHIYIKVIIRIKKVFQKKKKVDDVIMCQFHPINLQVRVLGSFENHNKSGCNANQDFLPKGLNKFSTGKILLQESCFCTYEKMKNVTNFTS